MTVAHHNTIPPAVSSRISSCPFSKHQSANLATGSAFCVAASSCPGARALLLSNLRRRSDV